MSTLSEQMQINARANASLTAAFAAHAARRADAAAASSVISRVAFRVHLLAGRDRALTVLLPA
jgi:hypothetical protein